MLFHRTCLLAVAATASLACSEIIQGVVSSTLEVPLDSVRISVKESPGVIAFSDAKGTFTLNTEPTALYPSNRHLLPKRPTAWHSLSGQWLDDSDSPPAGIYFRWSPSAPVAGRLDSGKMSAG